ncbi:MAG: HK97 family phage prohead protease [Pseudomonadota bacterium]
MTYNVSPLGLERKYCAAPTALKVEGGTVVSGYASVFGVRDRGGDTVCRGACAGSLSRLAKAGRKVKMLWQHDPARPIGIWDDVREDAKGLWVKGRILADVQAGAEALALLKAGAIEGLSIGYRTERAEKAAGGGRMLHEIDLWEVSLVTFPMLPEARVETEAKAQDQLAEELVAALAAARRDLLA